MCGVRIALQTNCIFDINGEEKKSERHQECRLTNGKKAHSWTNKHRCWRKKESRDGWEKLRNKVGVSWKNDCHNWIVCTEHVSQSVLYDYDKGMTNIHFFSSSQNQDFLYVTIIYP